MGVSEGSRTCAGFIPAGSVVGEGRRRNGFVCSRRPSYQRTLPVRQAEIVESSDAVLDQQVSSSDTPVLVDFYAQWCGPCKLLNPILDWASEEYGSGLKILKIDADTNNKSVAKYNISALPTLILFKNGEMKSQIVGAVAKSRVSEFLKENI
ncbi:hypothetical protein NDN08_008079 [Rhodosorus marinus]|uniref:Thioredoxin domain-containing protein n=1 Tax=Rhodosorus marinus TaxID=101924 RepID=A0AAV8V3R7_9RHOD|nr:hypothetical protein NDN08_008079 [Rhodosorus marinus]